MGGRDAGARLALDERRQEVGDPRAREQVSDRLLEAGADARLALVAELAGQLRPNPFEPPSELYAVR